MEVWAGLRASVQGCILQTIIKSPFTEQWTLARDFEALAVCQCWLDVAWIGADSEPSTRLTAYELIPFLAAGSAKNKHHACNLRCAICGVLCANLGMAWAGRPAAAMRTVTAFLLNS